jgi:hypothetical protein
MSKKQIERGLSVAYSLTKDIAGNTLSGNDVRAMGYIRALHSLLESLQDLAQAGSDVRAEMRYEERIKAIQAKMDADHATVPFSGDKIGESFARFEKAGFSSSEFLTDLNQETH